MQVFLVFVLCILAVNGYETVPAQITCRNGWEKFGEQCFKYIAVAKTWLEAEQNCQSLGGNLASVHNKETQNFLKLFTKRQTDRYTRTWIGLHDGLQNFFWLWSDGTKYVFDAWHSGEPNNQKNVEHCAEMNFGDEVLWNDIPCDHHHYSVCKQPAIIEVSFLSSKP
ncbi:galactose-specific lectin nattectin-like [Brachyhypopomus gauderio]|uniref:galactose-specific lectin nattectin-like n=1 Tax=Brachyhypopomus gauderio TaxID=698409 RepID=UPI00404195D6